MENVHNRPNCFHFRTVLFQEVLDWRFFNLVDFLVSFVNNT
ncbi:hypothetical protein RND81_09G039900 [Saponaria officinalis]|uniref:Uncharacterized protein n=1 Tax=Saponaria officinalis TaxID=3572 RepID=A0AAW1IGN4_SAPOF